uniref:Uncharacterized protein n=1 Tax=Candidatus Kentrum sp. UNK TaxID=2126344 RepID=A0A451AVD1_9GAMM|nr:MAG: hypothetical protein BECKUNK1418G_GA0071005_101222 [Candidatus Kentron sp. UNK]VFK69857.1 MAG: hypothetical protein BECKUNK1418H_GA0071006_102020 [Candidatus Kentron sp. UNK]
MKDGHTSFLPILLRLLKSLRMDQVLAKLRLNMINLFIFRSALQMDQVFNGSLLAQDYGSLLSGEASLGHLFQTSSKLRAPKFS